MLASVDATAVIVAAIGAVASCLSVAMTLLIRQEVKTANGGTLAGKVQETHDAAIEANGLVRRRLGERVEDEPIISRPREERTRLDDD